MRLAALALLGAAIVTAQNPRRIILDIDPGIDDAMALLLATQSPELEIEAVTVVSGNVMVDLGAQNALKLVELAGRPDIPVAKGARHPLRRRLVTAEMVHGRNGLGGLQLPVSKKQLDPRYAVDLIIELVNSNPGEITLVPVGPLTNIALALRKDPGLASKIPKIILMGGSIGRGNSTPAAEANIHNDAEAASEVFESGIPITMVGLGATSQVLITREHLGDLRASPSPIAKAVASMAEFYIAFNERAGRSGASLHDPLAVGLAIDKNFATEMKPMRIDVETRGEHTYGMTVANRNLIQRELVDAGDHDELGEARQIRPNAEVPLVIDQERFVHFFLNRIANPVRSRK